MLVLFLCQLALLLQPFYLLYNYYSKMAISGQPLCFCWFFGVVFLPHSIIRYNLVCLYCIEKGFIGQPGFV
jgi:hypothetical protein